MLSELPDSKYYKFFATPYSQCVFLLTLIAFGGWIYWPGLAGGFLFDDFPNLSLFDRVDIQSDFWIGVAHYLDGGFAGPTKRPVAMASFLLEYPSWPYDPEPFKRTNILLHLVASLLVFWLALLLCLRANISKSTAPWVAMVAMAIFLLHPLQVSTTLYVIQRMTILAAIFAIAGLIVYIKASEQLSRGEFRGWVLLLLVYPCFALLSLFSKENGILLALFVPLVYLAFPSSIGGSKKLLLLQRRSFQLITFVPGLILLLWMSTKLIQVILYSSELSNRDFTVTERLLTQPRVIWNYLYDIFVPKMQSAGLYNDSFVISESILSPYTTIIAIVALVFVAAVGFFLINKAPILAVAILGYLAAHLLESSFIGLEIYFEHRNYLPIVFLSIGIAWLIYYFSIQNRKAAVILASVVIALISFLTYQRVQLWSDETLLALVWAEKNPRSERALLDAANHLTRLGAVKEAERYVEKAVAIENAGPRPSLQALGMGCKFGSSIDGVTLERTAHLLRDHTYHQATYQYLKMILRLKESGECDHLTVGELRMLVRATFEAQGIRSGNIKALEYYELGNLDLLDKNGEKAFENYNTAMSLRGDVQVGIVEVARLASANYGELALTHIEGVRKHNNRKFGNDRSPIAQRQYAWIEGELNRIKAILTEDAVVERPSLP